MLAAAGLAAGKLGSGCVAALASPDGALRLDTLGCAGVAAAGMASAGAATACTCAATCVSVAATVWAPVVVTALGASDRADGPAANGLQTQQAGMSGLGSRVSEHRRLVEAACKRLSHAMHLLQVRAMPAARAEACSKAAAFTQRPRPLSTQMSHARGRCCGLQASGHKASGPKTSNVITECGSRQAGSCPAHMSKTGASAYPRPAASAAAAAAAASFLAPGYGSCCLSCCALSCTEMPLLGDTSSC